tara:strand:+ start:221 stop:502 length:282 start_codon:yes stop_codon:yes gene_type:complete
VKTIIESIEIKLEKLIYKYNQTIKKNSDLKVNYENLSKKVNEQKSMILSLQDKIKLINISKSVDKNKEDVKATRSKINEYIRELDKCIALLNK